MLFHRADHAFKVLVTDLDGVIRVWPATLARAAEAHAGLAAGSIAEAAFGDRNLLEAAITGRLSDEQWRRAITMRLCAAAGRDVSHAIQEWSSSPGQVDPVSVREVRRLRESLEVALFSNATTRLPNDLARLGLDESFDHVVNSSSIGAAKPAVEAFEYLLEILGPASWILYVDDDERNVRAAVAQGIEAAHYRGHETWREVRTRLGLPL